MGGVFKKVRAKRGHRLGGRKKGFGAAGPRHLGISASIPRVVGIEHKFYDTFAEGEVVSNAADMSGMFVNPEGPGDVNTLISTPAQGDGAQNRDGKKIVIDTIIINGVLSIPTRIENTAVSNGIQYPTVMIALVQDTQTNGVRFLSEDAFTNPSASIILAGSPLKNLLNSTRFNTLKTWEVDMRPTDSVNNATAGTVSTAGQNVRFSGFLKVHIPVNFNGGIAANIESVSDNSLHILAVNNVALSFVELSYNARIRFVG